MKPTRSLDDIDKLKDQAQRGAEAIAYAAYARDMAKRALKIRDDAIRNLRKAGHTGPQIAAETGAGLPTVRIVLR